MDSSALRDFPLKALQSLSKDVDENIVKPFSRMRESVRTEFIHARDSPLDGARRAFDLSKKALIAALLLWAAWSYCTKMLDPTVSAITSFAFSIPLSDGSNLNAAYYDPKLVAAWLSISVLTFFLLAQNEFRAFLKPLEWKGYITSLTAVVIAILIPLMVDNLEFSPDKGLPFLLLGIPAMAGYALSTGDLPLILTWRASTYQTVRTVAPILIFAFYALNVSMAPPILTEDLVNTSSALIVGMAAISWILIRTEAANSEDQERRYAAFMFILATPLVLYTVTRIIFLLNNPDSVTRDRWDLDWSFMDDPNAFEINVWPMEVVFGEDSRWEFYIAAVINSARVTLVSIVLCTLLGIIIGVTRLSSNRLASSLATIYVEVFRNLPLAVLLFLVWTQMGETLPLFGEEANISGWVYYSNKGFWIPLAESWRVYAFLATFMLLWVFTRIKQTIDMRRQDSVVDDSDRAVLMRSGIWGAIIVIGTLFVLGDITTPEILKLRPDSPGTWRVAEGTAFEITPMFTAMVLGLTLFTASVVAEIVRGSIQALPRGQVEAAISLALTPYQRLRLVILPQALRSMVPLLNSQYMNVWKNSSLAIVVAYSDVFYVIFVMMNNVGRLIPLFILLLVTYQVGSLLISGIMNAYNARVTRVKI
ncbi:MAG TPA: ABC transporter permease subunit [Candidatus Thalassarchaeaceae archaeon]|nr:MAG TPA: ABC transporter permease subunit [Candidatus Poseidoniales archaeon]HII90465.1 ABC transporter permease subunit [Candidatus Thalassarchaeaceae archaeon]